LQKHKLTIDCVPKEKAENLRFRKSLIEAGFKGSEYRNALMDSCAADPLFFMNAFCWIYESRSTTSNGKCLPFITWDFQDETILNLVEAVYRSNEETFDADRVILKSRDMGASWICITIFTWFWMFERECSLLMLSAKEEMVDKAGNPKSLFAKVMYLVERMPAWMRPNYYKTSMHLENKDNRSVIDGEATAGTTAVSDRRLAILLDEFGKVDSAGKEANLAGTMLRQTADVSNCRIFNSTPEGQDSGFAVVAASGKKVIRLHWSRHPQKNLGLYRVSASKLEVIDKDWHEKHPDYEFRNEPGLYEGLRSPWYDREWDRRLGIKRDISQELDMDFVGSGDPYFDVGKMAAIKMEYCLDPFSEGEIKKYLDNDYLDDDARLNRAKAWFYSDDKDKPPQGCTYTIGIDIGTGNGTSDSAIAVVNDITKEKIFEFITNGMTPEEFAKVTVDVAEWFSTNIGKAFLIWDMSGPGIPYGSTVINRYHYGSVYYYTKTTDRNHTKSTTPGYPSNAELKHSLFGLFRTMLYSGDYITRSKKLYDECMQYIYDNTGRIAHTQERSGTGSAKGANHGDIAYSEALAVMGMVNRSRPVKVKQQIPFGSYAWRVQEANKKERVEYSMFVA